MPTWHVSVPLRGKEGARHTILKIVIKRFAAFPSPCGVRRVRDLISIGVLDLAEFPQRFPSPCGVRRVRDGEMRLFRRFFRKLFPSPCGVRRVRDTDFPPVSTCRDGSGFRPLAG